MKLKTILVLLEGSKNSIKNPEKAIYLAGQCDAMTRALYVTPFYYRLKEPKLLLSSKKEGQNQARKFMKEARVLPAKKVYSSNPKSSRE